MAFKPLAGDRAPNSCTFSNSWSVPPLPHLWTENGYRCGDSVSSLTTAPVKHWAHEEPTLELPVPPAASLPAVLRSNVLAHGHWTERVREGTLAPGRPSSWECSQEARISIPLRSVRCSLTPEEPG